MTVQTIVKIAAIAGSISAMVPITVAILKASTTDFPVSAGSAAIGLALYNIHYAEIGFQRNIRLP